MTLRTSHRVRLVALGLSASLAIAACGGDGDDTTPDATDAPGQAGTTMNEDMDMTSTTMMEDMTSTTMEDMTTSTMAAMMGAEAVASGASTLRAGLTAQFQEHVYLAGIAVYNAVNNPDAFEPSAETLDVNSQGLAAAMSSLYGEDAGAAFLELWRSHIGFLVNYTTAAAGDDRAGKQQARGDLAQYGQDFGTFLAAANPNLTVEAVAGLLEEYVGTLLTAIDQVVAGDVAAFGSLKTAAAHMPMVAEGLSGAIATQFPDQFAGGASSPAATLRAGLTAQLQEHVYLAGIAIYNAVGFPDAFEASAETLDANSQDLAASLTSVYGEDAGAAFLELWRSHIGLFVSYTTAAVGADDAGTQQVRDDLAQYGEDFGAYLAAVNPNLTVEAIADQLEVHVGTLLTAIDQVVAGDMAAFASLKTAAAHMPMVAEGLSGAIATQFPKMFTG